MMNEAYIMRDPTAELSDILRERISPSIKLSDATIGLLSISKERSDEFMDALEGELTKIDCSVLRFRKPTYTRPAPEHLLQLIVEKCDVAIVGLAD